MTASKLPVAALVRGPSHAAAKKRLHDTLTRRGYLEAAEQVQADGVQVVAGDLSEECLGLPEEEFRDLAGGVILHVAAEVHHLQGYSALEATNVAGTRRLLSLATLAPTKFVLISTESAQESRRASGYGHFVVLYCNFRSLPSLGLLGFLIRQLKVSFIATLLSAAKDRRSTQQRALCRKRCPAACTAAFFSLGWWVRTA